MGGIGIGLRLECGEGLGVWVWGGGVWLKCRSGLLGCWLHPLDAVRNKGVDDLGGIDVSFAVEVFFAFGGGCGSVRRGIPLHYAGSL